MITEFEGKHIVVTGASGGLGTAVVQAVLDAGATCHLPFIEGRTADYLPWSQHGRVTITHSMDLTDEVEIERFYSALPELWASIHLIGGFSMAPLTETSLADFEHMLALNAKTCFLSCREAVKSMRKTGDGGRIVNVTARPVLEPTAGMLAYSVSKAAVAALTQSLAVELQNEHILVNAVVPSIIDTPRNREAMPDADHDTWPKPEQLAQSIRFLASPQNHLTSGSLVPVYGRA
ncbi:MAG: SDR family NAD(P)-dependent oxidoreductase [Proteobacteria bacterium]|nr:SDR family NAD(P)-dependent oxidoreductase [Pseudomonadota bacterium]